MGEVWGAAGEKTRKTNKFIIFDEASTEPVSRCYAGVAAKLMSYAHGPAATRKVDGGSWHKAQAWPQEWVVVA